MNRGLIFIIILLVFGVASAAGCSQQTSSSASNVSPITDYTSLVDSLRKAGATVEPLGEEQYPVLTARGRAIKVNGENVSVLEYSDEAKAKAEANFVQPGGQTLKAPPDSENRITIVNITPVAPPHWYQAGRLIVVYAGKNQAMTGLLESLLGKQFAGQ